ncbi:MAG TPA: hypothetical protein VF796_18460, partial [Humisphaera sp.]
MSSTSTTTTAAILTTGSGADLPFGPPDASGFLEPLGLDASGLQQTSTSAWVERRPNGFRLYYGESPAPETSDASAPPSPERSGDCPVAFESTGFLRNNLPPAYAVPFVGTPVNAPDAEGTSGQTDLCAIDEWADEAGAYGLGSFPDALDRATGLARRLARGFSLLDRNSGNRLGRADALCLVNLTSGNLCVSVRLPSAGPADPPVRLTYNSRSAGTRGELGHGWTHLYAACVRPDGGTGDPRFLYRVDSPAGDAWQVVRHGVDGPPDYVLDPLGRQTTFLYASSSYADLSGIEDSAGRTTSLTIDAGGDLVAIGFPDGTSVALEYDADHRLTAWTNPEGDVTRFEYDACDLLTAVVDPMGERTAFDYPTAAERTMTDPLAAVTTFTLGATGDVATVVQPRVGGTITTTYAWDPLQRVRSVTDGNGHTTTFAYASMDDRSGRLAAVVQPTGTFTYAWDAGTGLLRSIVDQNGARSTLTWGTASDRVGFEDAGGNHWGYDYDAGGRTTAFRDPLGNATTFVYDAVARRAAAVDPLGGRTTFAYDAASRLAGATNPLGQTTSFAHDAMNRLRSVTDANGDTTTFAYDGNGRRVAVTNPLWQTTTTIYDAAGRAVATTNPLGNTTTSTYDAAGRRTAVTNPLWQ